MRYVVRPQSQRRQLACQGIRSNSRRVLAWTHCLVLSSPPASLFSCGLEVDGDVHGGDLNWLQIVLQVLQQTASFRPSMQPTEPGDSRPKVGELMAGQTNRPQPKFTKGQRLTNTLSAGHGVAEKIALPCCRRSIRGRTSKGLFSHTSSRSLRCARSAMHTCISERTGKGLPSLHAAVDRDWSCCCQHAAATHNRHVRSNCRVRLSQMYEAAERIYLPVFWAALMRRGPNGWRAALQNTINGLDTK